MARKGFLARSWAEFRGMARDGFAHPSSRPVLAGTLIGAYGGWALAGSWALGTLIGFAFAMWNRVR